MENIVKLFERAFEVFLFGLSALILLSMSRELSSEIGLVKNLTAEQNIIYEQQIDELDPGSVSKAEIISSLLGSLEYDVEINQLDINKDTYDYKIFDFSQIPSGEYKKSYKYDSSGNIIKVIFKK